MEHPIKVLWVCNVMLPRIARALNTGTTPIGGWLEGLSEDLLSRPETALTVCFPMPGTAKPVKGEADGLVFYGFSSSLKRLDRYDPVQEEQFRQIIDEVKPDLLHVFGTEYTHSLAAVKAFGKPEQTMIHIQGLVSVYAIHFMANLPWKVQKQYTFRDLIRGENLLRQQKKFIKRGILECQAIQQAGHIMGRTDWDRACTAQISPDSAYHLCQETLRASFYRAENRWSLERCRRHSIFLSQGSYPIKGLHHMLEAMAILKERYPDAVLYVAGKDISRNETWKDRLRQSAYDRYILRLLDRYQLKDSVVFTGFLDEEKMCGQYRLAHVFVCPSSIENSPNSVGEAMALGMPVVSADMGGVKSMLVHGEEGLLYQADAPYMLAYEISRIFDCDELACRLGSRARDRAMKNHNREENARQVLAVYQEIYREAKIKADGGSDGEYGKKALGH